MKKVIALNEKEIRVLTTRKTSEKNEWWITHNLEVAILPLITDKPKISTEPEVGNIMEGGNRFYKVLKSEKVLICSICKQKANFKIGYRFFCKKHYKHLMLTRPIRRAILQPNRNETCHCGSGKKFKICCIHTLGHNPRRYFNSRFAENDKMIKSLKTD